LFFSLLLFVLARVAGIEPACLPLGDQDGRQLPYYTRISNPPRKRGGAVGRPVAVGSAAFCLGNWDRAFLRSRCDVPFSLCRTAMRARFRKYGQVGFSPPYTEG